MRPYFQYNKTSLVVKNLHKCFSSRKDFCQKAFCRSGVCAAYYAKGLSTRRVQKKIPVWRLKTLRWHIGVKAHAWRRLDLVFAIQMTLAYICIEIMLRATIVGHKRAVFNRRHEILHRHQMRASNKLMHLNEQTLGLFHKEILNWLVEVLNWVHNRVHTKVV